MIYTSTLNNRARTAVPKILDTVICEIKSIKFDGLNVILNHGGYSITAQSRRRIHLPLKVVDLLNAKTGDFVTWTVVDGQLTIGISHTEFKEDKQVSKSIDWDKAEVLIIHDAVFGKFTGNKHKYKNALPNKCASNLCKCYVCYYGTCNKTGDKCTACKL